MPLVGFTGRAESSRRPLMLFFVGAAFLSLCTACQGTATARQAGPSPKAPKNREFAALSELAGPADPLVVHDLHFDARFAVDALAYLESGDRRLLDQLARSPAALHILNHARNFENADVPRESAEALVASLLEPREERAKRAAACGRSLAFFTGPLLDDLHWLHDVLRYLPAGFRFHGTLFLTFGYDIGVAFPPNASLNGATPHFDGHPRELLYYAIHELHHAGFMTIHPPPRFADLKTCRDLLSLVRYSTQLEGMAVFAAWERRRAEGALGDDADYVALQDAARMERDEALYFKDYDGLKKRAGQPADKDAWAVIERMSGGERLWYRVGAVMADRIEKKLGRPALVNLVGRGPGSFFQSYLSLRDRSSTGSRSWNPGKGIMTPAPAR